MNVLCRSGAILALCHRRESRKSEICQLESSVDEQNVVRFYVRVPTTPFSV
jgi:hypothetical protein